MKIEADTKVKRSRGRPKVFDREVALDKAMMLFWQHGYEATSLADLVNATGAKAPTLYAEFTNKEGLFHAVLDRYIAQFAAKQAAMLYDHEKTLAQALGDYFRTAAACFTSDETPAGCFIINTSATLAANSADIANTIKARHSQQEMTLAAFFTERQHKGDLPENCDVTALANYLNCVLQGMSVSAREGASYQRLERVIDATEQLLPALITHYLCE